MTNAEPALDAVRRSGDTRPFVVAQLGQSPGRIVLPSDETTAAALDHLHRLPAAADDPQLRVLPVGRNRARIVMDPNGIRAPCRWMEANGAPVFIIRRRGCPVPLPHSASPIYVDGYGRGISCEAIVHAVAERGFRRSS